MSKPLTAKMAANLLRAIPLNAAFLITYFAEGGRLERELEYVEQQLGKGAGASNEMIIQTPANADSSGTASILTPEALLAHLNILKAATRVVVERDDT